MLWIERFQRQVVDLRRLPRHAIMIHRVRTIGPNLHLEDCIRACTIDSFDRNTNRSQILSQLPVIDGKIDKVANPLWGKFHEESSALQSSVILRRALCVGTHATVSWKLSVRRSACAVFAQMSYAHCRKNLTSP